MNKKKAMWKKNLLLQKLKHTSRSGNKRNFIKCWKGTSYKHWRTLSDIAWKLINQGYEVYTEVEFIKGGRADLLVLSVSGDGYIIEIRHSEGELSLSHKKTLYPPEFEIIDVPTANFDINKWEL